MLEEFFRNKKYAGRNKKSILGWLISQTKGYIKERMKKGRNRGRSKTARKSTGLLGNNNDKKIVGIFSYVIIILTEKPIWNADLRPSMPKIMAPAQQQSSKEEIYKGIKIAGFISFIPIVLLSGSLGGYFLGSYLQVRFGIAAWVTTALVIIGLLMGAGETVRIIKLIMRLDQKS